MKIIGAKREIETLLTAIPCPPYGNSPMPKDGWGLSYRGVPIDIELTEEPIRG